MLTRRLLLLVQFTVVLAAMPGSMAAQRIDTLGARLPAGMRGGEITQDQILARLRALGMSRAQVRAELQRRGYDPSLADPYFDIMERDPSPSGRRQADFVSALADIGLANDPLTAQGDLASQGDLQRRAGALDSLGIWPDSLVRDSSAGFPGMDAPSDVDIAAVFGLTPADRLAASRGLEVFGRAFFRRAGGQVETPLYGPVSPDYRLGPGDEVQVVLTGAVQDAYRLIVSREGTLVVPEAGELVVNGLTLGATEDLLRARLSAAYASVGAETGAVTRVGVSLGRVRAVQVWVVGDVEQPGGLQVSSLATILGALYRAGGPTETGSFRTIELRRAGEALAHFDLYEYLLRGDTRGDVRLHHDDVVFVPPVERRVTLEGAVRRPAIYELLPGEGLGDLLRLAGGPAAAADLEHVRVDRIVPLLERETSSDRVLLDADAAAVLAGEAPDVPLLDGDRVRVFSVSDERRSRVTVVGAVAREGLYAWRPGTTLADVLRQAGGVRSDAYLERVHVYRLDPVTGARHLMGAPAGSADPVAAALLLADRDSVVVYDRERLRSQAWVNVSGRVRRPGRYPLAEGTTVQDIVLTAGGFAPGADRSAAYVGRPALTGTPGDPTGSSVVVALGAVNLSPGDASPPSWSTLTDGFTLRHGDQVDIRPLPGWEEPRRVAVSGEVSIPGAYLLTSRGDRLTTILETAGGTLPTAQPGGIHLVRKGDLVAVDLEEALRRPGSDADLLLMVGDSIHVPPRDATVLLTGAVVFRSRVPYRPGMDFDDYVREAGGYAPRADRSAASVTYPNGHRESVRARAILPDSRPEVRPGSTIFVPEKPMTAQPGVPWTQVAAQAISAIGAIATLVFAINSR